MQGYLEFWEDDAKYIQKIVCSSTLILNEKIKTFYVYYSHILQVKWQLTSLNDPSSIGFPHV